MTIGVPGKAAAYQCGEPFNRCTHVAFSPKGEIYVSDGYGNSRVHKYSPDGKLLLSWGESGSDPGQFNIVHNIVTDKDGWVYVADRENNRVQVFSDEGEYLGEWQDLYHPMDIWEDASGTTLVTDQIPRLSAFDSNGVLVGRCRPVLYGAHGVWGDAAGNLFLAEHPPMDRITRLVPVSDSQVG